MGISAFVETCIKVVNVYYIIMVCLWNKIVSKVSKVANEDNIIVKIMIMVVTIL